MVRIPLSLTLVACLALAACAAKPSDMPFDTPSDTPSRLAAAVASEPLVLLGEVHDDAAQHALRAQALRRLLESGARPALLMEQFDRERQADLDRALARPGVTVDAVIAAATPADPAMQGWSWPLYRPYIALALAYHLPIVAVNVSREDTRRVLTEGLSPLGFDARVPPDIEAVQGDAIAGSHCGLIDTAMARRMVGAQVARDQFMARALEAHADRGAVLFAGNGHVRRDVGVPRWLDAASRARSVSIGMLESDGAQAAPDASDYDLAFVTPTPARPDPCAGMRASSPAASAPAISSP